MNFDTNWKPNQNSSKVIFVSLHTDQQRITQILYKYPLDCVISAIIIHSDYLLGSHNLRIITSETKIGPITITKSGIPAILPITLYSEDEICFEFENPHYEEIFCDNWGTYSRYNYFGPGKINSRWKVEEGYAERIHSIDGHSHFLLFNGQISRTVDNEQTTTLSISYWIRLPADQVPEIKISANQDTLTITPSQFGYADLLWNGQYIMQLETERWTHICHSFHFAEQTMNLYIDGEYIDTLESEENRISELVLRSTGGSVYIDSVSICQLLDNAMKTFTNTNKFQYAAEYTLTFRIDTIDFLEPNLELRPMQPYRFPQPEIIRTSAIKLISTGDPQHDMTERGSKNIQPTGFQHHRVKNPKQDTKDKDQITRQELYQQFLNTQKKPIQPQNSEIPKLRIPKRTMPILTHEQIKQFQTRIKKGYASAMGIGICIAGIVSVGIQIKQYNAITRLQFIKELTEGTESALNILVSTNSIDMFIEAVQSLVLTAYREHQNENTPMPTFESMIVRIQNKEISIPGYWETIARTHNPTIFTLPSILQIIDHLRFPELVFKLAATATICIPPIYLIVLAQLLYLHYQRWTQNLNGLYIWNNPWYVSLTIPIDRLYALADSDQFYYWPFFPINPHPNRRQHPYAYATRIFTNLRHISTILTIQQWITLAHTHKILINIPRPLPHIVFKTPAAEHTLTVFSHAFRLKKELVAFLVRPKHIKHTTHVPITIHTILLPNQLSWRTQNKISIKSLQAIAKTYTILGYIHNHINGQSIPSEADLEILTLLKTYTEIQEPIGILITHTKTTIFTLNAQTHTHSYITTESFGFPEFETPSAVIKTFRTLSHTKSNHNHEHSQQRYIRYATGTRIKTYPFTAKRNTVKQNN